MTGVLGLGYSAQTAPREGDVPETLARVDAAQVGALHQTAIRPLERSGAAWTLKSLVLSQTIVPVGAALCLAGNLIGDIETLGESCARRLLS